MHRIDTPTAQKDKFGVGKNGFTRGNPQTGTPATDLDNDYFDMLQEELAGVVEATGVNLDKSKHNQLLTALKALNVGRLINIQTFTSSGVYTPTPGTKSIIVTVCGGGGAGGSSPANGAGISTVTSGGAGGSYAEAYFLISSLSSTVSISVGSGGAPVANTSGGTGGTSKFGDYITCSGGAGGQVLQQSNIGTLIFPGQGPRGAIPVISSALAILKSTQGGFGQSGFLLNGLGVSGPGGNSVIGMGGGNTSGGAGTPVSGNGGGGGGAFGGNGSAAFLGGSGAPGVVIIEEYA